MKTMTFNQKDYQVDLQGFLLNPEQWDEDFAEGMARYLGMLEPLSEQHWRIIRYIRMIYEEMLRRPTAAEVCNSFDMTIQTLRTLFPTGHFRGACLLAGMNSGEKRKPSALAEQNGFKKFDPTLRERVYLVDAQGFLVDPGQWDEYFAVNKADELKVPGQLNDDHWRVIRYLRDRFFREKEIPTIYETCQANEIDIENLHRLFPDGYHRGAIKIAGLRNRTA